MEEIIFEPRNKHLHTPDEKRIYDCIVIGTGVCGYACAMYAARLGLKTLVIGEIPGGTLALTGTVENYPGFASIDGQMLTQLLENHAKDYDVDILTDIVDDVTLDNETFKAAVGKRSFEAKTIVFATGGSVRKLGIPGEQELFGKGVNYCALCDAASIKGKVVAIAGGGDGAIKEAILISEYAKRIYIINNEQELHIEVHNRKLLAKHIKEGRIEVINDNEVVRIEGAQKVERVLLYKKYKAKEELFVQAVFVYIGHIPNSAITKKLRICLNQKQEIIVNQNCETNIPGVFAAGDVTDNELKQAIMAVAQGVRAAFSAYDYLRRK